MHIPYIANLIFSISCDGIFTEQYEEQLRLVFASNTDDAIRQATEIGSNHAEQFVDRNGRMITWNFIAVKEINQTELEAGALIYSSIKEVEPIGMI